MSDDELAGLAHELPPELALRVASNVLRIAFDTCCSGEDIDIQRRRLLIAHELVGRMLEPDADLEEFGFHAVN